MAITDRKKQYTYILMADRVLPRYISAIYNVTLKI